MVLPAGAAKRSPQDSPFADREPSCRGTFLPSAEPAPRPRVPGAGYSQSTIPCQGRAGGRVWRRGRACLGLDRHGMLPDPARAARAFLTKSRYGVRYHPKSAGNGPAGFHGSDSTAQQKCNTRKTFRLKTGSTVAFQMRLRVRTVKPCLCTPLTAEGPSFITGDTVPYNSREQALRGIGLVG